MKQKGVLQAVACMLVSADAVARASSISEAR